MAISAYLLRIASLQVLCPVAVFLMIQYLDRLRKSQTTFHFVSSRLATETLRVMGSVRSKPLLLDLKVVRECGRYRDVERALASGLAGGGAL